MSIFFTFSLTYEVIQNLRDVIIIYGLEDTSRQPVHAHGLATMQYLLKENRNTHDLLHLFKLCTNLISNWLLGTKIIFW